MYAERDAFRHNVSVAVREPYIPVWCVFHGVLNDLTFSTSLKFARGVLYAPSLQGVWHGHARAESVTREGHHYHSIFFITYKSFKTYLVASPGSS